MGDEATEMLAGGDIDKSRVVENGQYPIYANALTNDGIVGYYDDYYRVKAPAVTVTGRGDVGHAQARIDDFTPVVRLLAIRSEHDVYFLENAINKHVVIVESTGVPQLTVPQLGNYIISFPTTTEEEIKIGSYFHNLDHLISLHQRKYLQEKKTSLTWEQCKLEDVMDTVTDYVAAGSFEDIRNNVTYLNEPGYAQLVRTVDLKKKFTNNDSVYVDESAFKYLWRVNLNDECIVLPNIGANIGEVYFVEPSGLPYDNNVLGPNAILLKANEDTYFAFTALNNLTFQKQLFENVGSSGQPKFNKTKLKSIQLYMPQNEEQVKIGQYFRQLDHLITLHRRAHFHRRRRTYK